MIVDSSALLAVVFREARYEEILDVVSGEDRLGIGSPTLAETGLVLAATLGEDSRAVLARLAEDLDLTVIPFEAAHAREARDAFLRYGRGRHPAKLNFGDCLTYAVAKLSRQPLLFIGDDFSQTDLASALPP